MNDQWNSERIAAEIGENPGIDQLRFCVVGDAEAHVRKLRDLAKVGVRQFNVYLMNGDEEAQLELYAEKVIPALRTVEPAAIA